MVAEALISANSSSPSSICAGIKRERGRISRCVCTGNAFAYPKRQKRKGCLWQGLGINSNFFPFQPRIWEFKGRVNVMASNNGYENRGRHFISKKVDAFSKNIQHIVNMKDQYEFILGPIIGTAAIVLPPLLLPLLDLFEKSYYIGLAATFGHDLIFIVSSHLFFVLSAKAGRHQQVLGGLQTQVSPWEYIAYPKGLAYVLNSILYAGIVIAILTAAVSLVLGKGSLAIAAFGPYFLLILVQACYERLEQTDRVPVYPLVPIAYTVYRFRQLARSMEMVAIFGGGIFLSTAIKFLSGLWTLYFAIHLFLISQYYSTWNSNKTV